MLRSPLAVLFFAFSSCFLASFAVAQERRPVDVPPHSRVFGLVVDGQGKPLAGVFATLHFVGDRWAPGVEVPKIRWRGYDIEAFQTRSSADGRFEFDVVTPTADWVSLVLEPDVYHDVASRDFGPAGGRDKPRLLAGDNDLGQFELATTGAIAGKVLDEKAQPIAGVQVRLDDSFHGGMGRQTFSDASGAFTIEHVPAGTYGIEALRDGYEIAKSSKLVVAINATTAGGELVLAIAQTISGVVVDEQGKPIANARVWGWPEKSGTGSGARADAQGRFTVALKQVEPHYFEVEAEGFAKLEERGFPFGESKAHPVGATDVRLVMKPAVMTTFVVVDAATSQPVTRYAVSLAWRPTPTGSRGGGEPEYELADHPGGEFTCEADPALFDYVITSPGYGPAKGQVTHESTTSPRCAVKLWGGTRISGRVVLDGKPVAQARIVLRSQSLVRMHEEEGSGAFDENNFYWMPIDGQVDPFWSEDGERKSHTGRNGRFVCDDIEAGEYRLEILSGAARRSIDPIAVSAGQPVDLGDVELLAPATLRGRVLVPEGVAPDGIAITSFVFDQRGDAKTDAEGRFSITAPSGRWHVIVYPQPGKLAYGSGADLVYELAPNETREVELDLGDRAGCSVRIELFAHGQPLECGRLSFTSVADPKRVGAISVNGVSNVFSGWINALGATDVVAWTGSAMPLGPIRLAAELAPGGNVSTRVDVPCGRLALQWPDVAAGEKFTQVFCEGEVSGLRGKAYPRYFAESGPPHQDDVKLVAPNRCEFAYTPVGEFNWQIHICTKSGSEEGQRVYHAHFKIADGETTQVVVTERDRVQKQ